MADRNERTLVVGVRTEEREELQLWAGQQARDVWFARCGLEGLRVFEEVKPGTVVIDTMLPDIDSVRLARVLAVDAPSLRIVFVANHNIEAPYFRSLTDVEDHGFCFRPLDPEALFDAPTEDGEGLGGVPPRGEVTRQRLMRLTLEVLRQQASGVLYVGADAMRRVVYFREGRPTYATSTVLDENFGQFLLRQKIITPIEFNWARNFQLREGIMQGEALVKIGVLTPTRLERLLADQIQMKITNTIGLEHLPYHFDRYSAAPYRPRYSYNTWALLVQATEAGAAPLPQGNPTVRLVRALGDPVVDELGAWLGMGFVTSLRNGLPVADIETQLASSTRAATLIEILTADESVEIHGRPSPV